MGRLVTLAALIGGVAGSCEFRYEEGESNLEEGRDDEFTENYMWGGFRKNDACSALHCDVSSASSVGWRDCARPARRRSAAPAAL